jgi:predicted ATPase
MVQEPPKEPTDEEKQKQIDEIIKEMEKASLESQEPAKISTRDVGLSDTMKAVSTKLKAKQPEEASTTDSERRPAVPLVVCKHREASSMGDFEAMKSQQVSSRRYVIDVMLDIVRGYDTYSCLLQTYGIDL